MRTDCPNFFGRLTPLFLAAAALSLLPGSTLLLAQETEPTDAPAVVEVVTIDEETVATTDSAPAEDPEELARKRLLELFESDSSITNTLGAVMVYVPGGYRVCRHEVTQKEYTKVMGSNPSHFQGSRNPVEQVTQAEAETFCQRLTQQEHEANKLPETFAYSLPTEAQWVSYAEGTLLASGITSYLGDRRKTEPVEGLGKNQFGLYDVRGNVWEYCISPVARGASWRSHEDFLAIPFRFTVTPETRYDDIGFRIILLAK